MSAQKFRTDSQINRRLRLRDLLVFSAVAEHLSMAKATSLGVTQPTVSEVIADLEYTYGVKLFDRSPRGVQLTVYGHALLKRSVAIFDEINQSVKDIQFLNDPTVGEIRIVCLEGLSATFLPAILRQFAGQYPQVTMHVDNLTASTTDLSGLHNRVYDLALLRLDAIAAHAVTGDLTVRTLYDDDLVVAAGKSNPWTRRSKISLDELAEEPWILSPPGYWHHTRVEEAFRAQGLSMPKARIVSFTVTLRMELMATGPYISVFSGAVMRQNAERFRPCLSQRRSTE